MKGRGRTGGLYFQAGKELFKELEHELALPASCEAGLKMNSKVVPGHGDQKTTRFRGQAHATSLLVSGMLHVKDVLRVRSVQTPGKAKSQEKDGVRQSCVAVNWARATDRVLCFNDSNGALIAIEYPQKDRQAPPPISRIEFSAFHSVAAKLVPLEIRAFKDGNTVATMKVLEITEVREINPALFHPPSDAVLWPQCDDMQDAEPVDRVPLYYSHVMRLMSPKRVILYGVIEENGSLSHVTVIQGATPDTNTAALDAFRRWRYKPARCGQTPIRVETSMWFDFWR